MEIKINVNLGWYTFLAIFLFVFGLSAFTSIDPTIMKIAMFCAIAAAVLIVVSIVTGRSTQQ